MQRSHVLAFRAARHGLNERDQRSLTDAAACPIPEVARGGCAGARSQWRPTPSEPVPPKRLDGEAQRIAEMRGTASATVTWR